MSNNNNNPYNQQRQQQQSAHPAPGGQQQQQQHPSFPPTLRPPPPPPPNMPTTVPPPPHPGISTTTSASSDHPLMVQPPPTSGGISPPPTSGGVSGFELSSAPASHATAASSVFNAPLPAPSTAAVVSAAPASAPVIPTTFASASASAAASSAAAPNIEHVKIVPSKSGPQKTVKIVPTGAVTPSMTLDDHADEFLRRRRGGSGNDATATAAILRPPPPLEQPEAAEKLENDFDRLRYLAYNHKRAWNDVIGLTTKLLRFPSSHYTSLYNSLLSSQSQSSENTNSGMVLALESQQDELIEILTIQCHAFVATKKYTDLQREVKQWWNRRNALLSANASSNNSWIPWRLHILAATSLEYTTSTTTANSKENTASASNTSSDGNSEDDNIIVNSNDALDLLWKIRSRIPSDDLASRLLVEQALANINTKRKNWRMALTCLENAIGILPAAACSEEIATKKKSKNSKGTENAASMVLETAYRVELLSRQGRILLQVGALQEASQIFEEAASSWNHLNYSVEKDNNDDDNVASSSIIRRVPAQLHVNEGLLCFAYCKYDEALEFFRKAMNHLKKYVMMNNDTTNADSRSLVDHQSALDIIGIDSCEELYSETINNMSLCAIYTCKLNESIHIMEGLIRESPTKFLTERVALNLCTLYELGFDTAVAARKKRVLQLIAKRFYLHDIGPECFRLG